MVHLHITKIYSTMRQASWHTNDDTSIYQYDYANYINHYHAHTKNLLNVRLEGKCAIVS